MSGKAWVMIGNLMYQQDIEQDTMIKKKGELKRMSRLSETDSEMMMMYVCVYDDEMCELLLSL